MIRDTTKPVMVSELTSRTTDRLVLKLTLSTFRESHPTDWSNFIYTDKKLAEAHNFKWLASGPSDNWLRRYTKRERDTPRKHGKYSLKCTVL